MIKPNLAVLMAKNDITQEKLHNDTGIVKKRLKQIKEGTNAYIKMEEIEKLCLYFNCTINDLYTYKN